jgi:hypothetical protein
MLSGNIWSTPLGLLRQLRNSYSVRNILLFPTFSQKSPESLQGFPQKPDPPQSLTRAWHNFQKPGLYGYEKTHIRIKKQ